MSSGYNPKLTPDDENFLKNFGISFGFNTPKVTTGTVDSTEQATVGDSNEEVPTIFKEDGSVD
jgi:hypothetical protein